ncbi:MAG: hypothetical protein ABI583_11970, partial [Betaproteobacteria bacterium]
MKSYVLENLSSLAEARVLLGRILPGQVSPWLLAGEGGDPVAYFNVTEADVDLHGPAVIADISGREYNKDEKVLEV